MDAIGKTDLNWFKQLRGLEPTPARVNFWTPTPWTLRRIGPGSRWYFMLKAPVRRIGGLGIFESYEAMSISDAWERFGLGNGVASLDELRQRTRKYAERRSQQELGNDHEIGCIILRDSEFWEEVDFLDPLSDLGTAVPDQVVKFKYVDSSAMPSKEGPVRADRLYRLSRKVEVPGSPTMIGLVADLSRNGPDHILHDPAFDDLIKALNDLAPKYEVGTLQQLRKDLKGLKRAPGKKVFGRQSIDLSGDSPYAFHLGGRSELQFNVGVESRGDVIELRHGVAFSLEPSQALPDPERTLLPKIRRFNEFVRLRPDLLAGFRFWWWGSSSPSPDEMVRPIPPHLATRGMFLFLGARQDISEVNLDTILTDFDLLLPLYRFVEGTGDFPDEDPQLEQSPAPHFQPGHRKKVSGSKAVTRAEKELEISFQHNEMQDNLYARLVEEFGEDAVGTEQTGLTGRRTAVDVVVLVDGDYQFYEIKVGLSARACLRQAVSQLMEYSYWPGSPGAANLIVVGKPEPDESTKEYVETIRTRFGMPLHYESMSGKRV